MVVRTERLAITTHHCRFYALNGYIYFGKVEAIDTGGSAVIHTFGAYFGLAASLFLTPKAKTRNFDDMCSSFVTHDASLSRLHGVHVCYAST
jgi:ammonia channel protein AmtB